MTIFRNRSLFVLSTLAMSLAVTSCGEQTNGLTLIAGQERGVVNGAKHLSRFSMPTDLALDDDGTMYVSDISSNTIRKISPDGIVSTLAGSPSVIGATDAAGSQASFNRPSTLTVDRARGLIYVADISNGLIRRITRTGQVDTLAGTGNNAGYLDGSATSAQFDFINNVRPYMVTDSSGNIFMLDTHNHTVRKITPTGIVTTFAGQAGMAGNTDATGPDARFHRPTSITIDSSDNLYIFNSNDRAIRKITPQAVVSTLIPSGVLPSISSQISIDSSGNFYAMTNQEELISFNASNGVTLVYTAPTNSHGIVTNANMMSASLGLVINQSGDVFIADQFNAVIRAYTSSGTTSIYAGHPVVGSDNGSPLTSSFAWPTGLTTDPTGNIWTVDAISSTVRRLNASNGKVMIRAGVPQELGYTDATREDARFDKPRDMTYNSSANRYYIVDSGNYTIRRMSIGGIVSTLAGSGSSGFTDGQGMNAQFKNPLYISSHPSAGILYVADSNTIRKVTTTGTVTTLVGQEDNTSYQNGSGSAATFSETSGLAVDSIGNIYTGDSNTIRKITPNGDVSTLAGTANDFDLVDATGAEARFGLVGILAVDSQDNLYVSDCHPNADAPFYGDFLACGIRKVSPSGVVTSTTVKASMLNGMAFDTNDQAYVLSENALYTANIN